MKSFLLVIACALALTACSSSTTTPDPTPAPKPTLPVSGTVTGVPAGVDLTTPGTTLEAQNGSGDVLGTATVNADGTFNVTLQEPTADQLDIAPTATGLLSPAALVTGFDCDSVDFSSASAKGTSFLEFAAVTDAGVLLGNIRQASSAEVATTWYDGTGTLPVGTGYINLYVTEALTIKATNCFRQSNLNINFEVVLGQGWNTLKINKAADGAITVTRKPDAEVGIWFFAGQ
jgi:hypothetical protein